MQPSRLDNPDYARFAWARYRMLMMWMTLVSAIATIAGLGGLWWVLGPLPIHMIIATCAAIFFSVLLAAALMGLVFLSSGTGHDEAIDDPFQDLNP